MKFWDIRNFKDPVSSFLNNTHWLWQAKYNKVYSSLMITCSSSTIARSIIFGKSNKNYDLNNTVAQLDYIEFDDSVYSIDWSANDPWSFAAISNGCYLHINEIPSDYKYKIMIDDN